MRPPFSHRSLSTQWPPWLATRSAGGCGSCPAATTIPRRRSRACSGRPWLPPCWLSGDNWEGGKGVEGGVGGGGDRRLKHRRASPGGKAQGGHRGRWHGGAKWIRRRDNPRGCVCPDRQRHVAGSLSPPPRPSVYGQAVCGRRLPGHPSAHRRPLYVQWRPTAAAFPPSAHRGSGRQGPTSRRSRRRGARDWALRRQPG